MSENKPEYDGVVWVGEKEIKESFKSQELMDKLYCLTHVTHHILTTANLRYWIDFGTLLGAVRHGGVIPWDDDVDFCCDVGNREKLLSLNYIFNKYGLQIGTKGIGPEQRAAEFFLEISMINSFNMSDNGRKLPFPFLDIFLTEERNGYYQYIFHKIAAQHPDNFPLDKLFPLQRYSFGAVDVMGPADGAAILVNEYGDKWDTIGHLPLRDHARRENIKQNSGIFYIKDYKEMMSSLLPSPDSWWLEWDQNKLDHFIGEWSKMSKDELTKHAKECNLVECTNKKKISPGTNNGTTPTKPFQLIPSQSGL